MGIVRTEGIILRTYPFSETSKIVHSLTLHHGIQSLLARGARRPRSRFGGGLETFTRLELVYYRKREGMLHTLSECSVIDSFPGLSGDLERFYAGMVVLEVVKRFATEEESDRSLYILIVETLARLESVPSRVVESQLLRFLWNFVGHLGFQPDLRTCASCGSICEETGALTAREGGAGVLCSACSSRDRGAFELGSRRASVIDLLTGGGSEEGFPADAQLMKNLWDFTTSYVRQHFHDERAISSLRAFLALLDSVDYPDQNQSSSIDAHHRGGFS